MVHGPCISPLQNNVWTFVWTERRQLNLALCYWLKTRNNDYFFSFLACRTLHSYFITLAMGNKRYTQLYTGSHLATVKMEIHCCYLRTIMRVSTYNCITPSEELYLQGKNEKVSFLPKVCFTQ